MSGLNSLLYLLLNPDFNRVHSLPVNFQPIASPTLSQRSLEQEPISTDTVEMRTALRNRMRQLQMLIYRPYVALLAQEDESTLTPSDLPILLRGSFKCLGFTVEFLRGQPEQVERHYGGWLLSRNIWSASLILTVACNVPAILENLNLDIGSSTQHASHDLVSTPGTDICRIFTIPEAILTAERACLTISKWSCENENLAICAKILASLLAETRRQRTAI